MQRKRRKKKRFGVFLFLLVVCIGIGIMFVPWAMQPENFSEVKNKINGFLYKEEFPDSYNAKSLILVDCSDDEIFVSKKENEPQIPASLAKLFVIEYASTLADLDSIVVADYGAISLTKPGSSVAQIKEKEYFLHNLFAAMLVPSGNDAAYVVADYCGGLLSPQAESCQERVRIFMENLNLHLQQQGYLDTVLYDPSGFDMEALTTTLDLKEVVYRLLESVKSRTVNGTGCPYCSHNFVLPGFNDLASRFPEIAAEWSERNLPLTPDQVTAFKNIKVWWKCHLGHEWNTLISTRAGGSQCPYCSGIKLLKGFNDLKTKYPFLAAEWSEKNLSLTPDAVNEKSTKNVWWKCNTCGYEWKAVVKARVKGGMCPVCAERAVLQGYNDLGTTDPYLLSEWDYEKNSKWTPSNVSRNSMKVVWWKCGAGHSYRAKITDRTIEQKGCPQCEAEFQQALPQMLIMMYGAQNGITVKSNSDSELGMRLVAYLPELHCAVDIAGATVTEKREQSVKAHICQSNRLGYYLIKRTADTSHIAAEIKTLFIRNHIYLHTDSEHDVQVLRERFLEWKNRSACKLNGKY